MLPNRFLPFVICVESLPAYCHVSCVVWIQPAIFLGVPGGWSKNEQSRKAEERLDEDPLDVESWNVLLREAQVRHTSHARAVRLNCG